MGSETIQELVAKGKVLLDRGAGEYGLFLLITLAILTSFGLGRLSALVEARPLIEVRAATAGVGEAIAPGGLYVASRSGSVYYFPWCSGAAQIAPQNERWFQSIEAAKRAGYRPAKNCKGLE
jgi:hypothetical protein